MRPDDPSYPAPRPPRLPLAPSPGGYNVGVPANSPYGSGLGTPAPPPPPPAAGLHSQAPIHAGNPPPPPAPSAPADPYANDPGYLAAKALGEKQKKDAANTYLENLKKTLLSYGDAGLAHSTLDAASAELEQYLGYKPDLSSFYAQFAGADNPDTAFTQLAQYNRAVRDGGLANREAVNNQGLWYSGHGAQQIADFGYDSQAKLAGLQGAVRDQTAAARGDFTNALNGVTSNQVAALQDAYDKQVAAALAGDYSDLPAVPAPPAPPKAKAAAPPKPVATKPVVKTVVKTQPYYYGGGTQGVPKKGK